MSHSPRAMFLLCALLLHVLPARALAEPPAAQKPRRAYVLAPEYDVPVIAIGAVMVAARLTRTQPAYCAPRCDKDDVNAIDRVSAGAWRPGFQRASDSVDLGIGLLSVAALWGSEGFADAAHDGVVVFESALLSMGVASLFALAVERPRPYMYGDDAPRAKRTSERGAFSFTSSHTAVAFALVTSTYITLRKVEARPWLSWLTLSAGSALATFVAAARVLGGMHFLSDVAAGAVVGTSLGVLVPSLHAPRFTLAPLHSGGVHGAALSGRF